MNAPSAIFAVGGQFYWYPALRCMFKGNSPEHALAVAQLAWWRAKLKEL